jgi:hypothetical protein
MSVISKWPKNPYMGFDRAQAALQNALSHQIVESILRDFLGTNFYALAFCHRFLVASRKIFYRIPMLKESYNEADRI